MYIGSTSDRPVYGKYKHFVEVLIAFVKVICTFCLRIASSCQKNSNSALVFTRASLGEKSLI